jgi:5-formyltetrahydrofolate cyclo-ligase
MPETEPADLAEIKKQARTQAKRQRAEAAQAAPDAGTRLRDHLLAEVAFPEGAPVSAYWPMGDEIDPLPTLHVLHERGHPIGLPVMPGKAQPLKFRRWTPDLTLDSGGFGTRIPPASQPEIVPEILLVPMLAFDRRGFRLGYGGGFYDRTLEALRARNGRTTAIGIVYAGQELPEVPIDANDQRLDRLMSEQGPIPIDAPGAG